MQNFTHFFIRELRSFSISLRVETVKGMSNQGKSLISQGLAIGFHGLGARTSTESQAEASDFKNRSRESRFESGSDSELNLVSSYSSRVPDLRVPFLFPIPT
ncbi:hypothetical protein AVEN_253737-1 [Araneus ventricosus]|uniref:Uncharacterized protein n=1 Tax=Araneus ventricosus TaxID=182803 RepID=A0A4Y2DZ83_ARAVE|nr:hypothetical protein AVEN_253737-1 [Araneus ventricosus]